jgi:hypothetical protein
VEDEVLRLRRVRVAGHIAVFHAAENLGTEVLLVELEGLKAIAAVVEVSMQLHGGRFLFPMNLPVNALST